MTGLSEVRRDFTSEERGCWSNPMWVGKHKVQRLNRFGGHLCEAGVLVKVGDWLYTRGLNR